MTYFKTIKEAEAYVGGLSKPNKMPGFAIGLPASRCKTGSKLRNVKGSVCSDCYACKGFYKAYKSVAEAQENRFKSLYDLPVWVEAMTFLINKRSDKHKVFRWHDSGDLQSMEHLHAIVHVALNTPSVRHWLPTKEYKLIQEYLEHWTFPSNLTVRVSMAMKGKAPSETQKEMWPCTSTVDSGTGFSCPVKSGTEGCDTYNCRACWDRSVENVNYHSH